MNIKDVNLDEISLHKGVKRKYGSFECKIKNLRYGNDELFVRTPLVISYGVNSYKGGNSDSYSISLCFDEKNTEHKEWLKKLRKIINACEDEEVIPSPWKTFLNFARKYSSFPAKTFKFVLIAGSKHF